MDDRRPRVPLNGRPINIDQLAAEVGDALTASTSEVVLADPASQVTAVELAAAVAAHTPAPVEPTPTLAELAAEVRGMKRAAAAEAAKSTTTARGVAAAIAADSA